jgi:peptidoglycan/LPS O-acetylase OafA/YrhL
MSPAGSQERIAALDGLRAISILLVLAAHLLPLGPKPLQLNATAGTAGMSLFFILSGFLIARAAAVESARSFTVKRLARIVPLAWLYIGVLALIHGSTGQQLTAELLFVLNYVPDLIRPETAHLWSLCVELHFYVAVALIILVDRRAIILVVPFCLGITALRISEGIPYSIMTHLRVDEILAGACVAIAPRRWLARGSGLGSGAALLLVAASHPDAGALAYLKPYAAALILTSLLAVPEGRVAQLLSSKSLGYVASISYALYVIHPLTAHGWWNAGSLAERYLLKRPLGLAITFALAHLSTFWFERWWMRLARQGLAISGRTEVRPVGVAPAVTTGGAARAPRAQHLPAEGPSRQPPAAP